MVREEDLAVCLHVTQLLAATEAAALGDNFDDLGAFVFGKREYLAWAWWRLRCWKGRGWGNGGGPREREEARYSLSPAQVTIRPTAKGVGVCSSRLMSHKKSTVSSSNITRIPRKTCWGSEG